MPTTRLEVETTDNPKYTVNNDRKVLRCGNEKNAKRHKPTQGNADVKKRSTARELSIPCGYSRGYCGVSLRHALSGPVCVPNEAG
jgi:hypothetical protein